MSLVDRWFSDQRYVALRRLRAPFAVHLVW